MNSTGLIAGRSQKVWKRKSLQEIMDDLLNEFDDDAEADAASSFSSPTPTQDHPEEPCEISASPSLFAVSISEEQEIARVPTPETPEQRRTIVTNHYDEFLFLVETEDSVPAKRDQFTFSTPSPKKWRATLLDPLLDHSYSSPCPPLSSSSSSSTSSPNASLNTILRRRPIYNVDSDSDEDENITLDVIQIRKRRKVFAAGY